MEVHPLLMPEVLTNTFKYFGVRDLFNCRLVSAAWNVEASQLIGSTIKTSITEETHFLNVLQLTKNFPNHPYRIFELQNVTVSFESTLTQEFFTICGPYMHHLTILYTRGESKNLSVSTLRDILLYYVPNLRSLTFQYLPYCILSSQQLFPPYGYPKFFQPALKFLKSITIFSNLNLQQTFLEDVFSLSNAIENVTVKFGLPPGEFKKRLINAMLAKKTNLRNLKSLNYFMHNPGPGSGWSWSEEECESLTNTGWNLRTLKLNPSRSSTDNGFKRLMEKMKNSLSRLTLRVHHPLKFPKLHLLTHLTLYDYEENLSFLENLPSLIYLGLCEYFPAKTITSENIIRQPSRSLTSLNLYGSTISDHLFKKIIVCFPNLRSLNVWHCNKKKLRSVAKHSKFLEELIMNVTDIDDEALTGIPSEICDQIERRLKNNSSYSDFSDELSHRSKPFIGDLLNLQRLELHGACLADWRWSSVGDVSLIYGIACVANLTSLYLNGFKWIGEESIKEVVRSVPLMQLEFNGRDFRESLGSEIRLIKPSIRLEHITDDYETYNYPRGLLLTDSAIPGTDDGGNEFPWNDADFI